MNDSKRNEATETQQEDPVAEMTPRESEQGYLGKLRKYDSFWGILLINFGVTGVLGLPLIWISKKFSGPQKILWSVIVTIYTALLIGLTVMVCIWAFRAITNS